MVTALSALARLKVLHFARKFDFRFPNHLHWEKKPCTRTVLPSLTRLNARGDTQTLDHFLARIDAPLLDYLNIAFAYYDFNTPELLHFIGRLPKFPAPDKAHIGVNNRIHNFRINFSWSKQISSAVRLRIHCPEPEHQLRHLLTFCDPHFTFSPLPVLEYLYIGRGRISPQSQQGDDRNAEWLNLLQRFTAVKNLYLTKEFASVIAHILQDRAGERTMVLPALENVFIELQQSGSVHEAIGKFAAARQLSGHPIVINHWDGRQGIP